MELFYSGGWRRSRKTPERMPKTLKRVLLLVVSLVLPAVAGGNPALSGATVLPLLPPGPATILSPLSPASIKRIPKTRDLLMVWNDQSHVDPDFRASAIGGGKRTPLTVAISRGEGKTWIHALHPMDDPEGRLLLHGRLRYRYTGLAGIGRRGARTAPPESHLTGLVRRKATV